jgi:hypothetical protein
MVPVLLDRYNCIIMYCVFDGMLLAGGISGRMARFCAFFPRTGLFRKGNGSVVLGASVVFLFPKIYHLRLFNLYTVTGVITSTLVPFSAAMLA